MPKDSDNLNSVNLADSHKKQESNNEHKKSENNNSLSLNEDFEIPSFKEQFNQLIKKYLLFLFIPGKKDIELTRMDFVINKTKSKRTIINKFKNPLTLLGIFIIFVMVSWAVFAPWISPYGYYEVNAVLPNAYQPPSPDHIFGTTKFGRDVYGRLIWGARSSLSIGLFSIVMSTFLGVLTGLYSGYKGGKTDSVIMRIMDIVMAFPGLILVIIIISIIGRNMENILLVYGILGIPGYARLMRGSVLQEKNKIYVEAAKVSGASQSRIMLKHILPNSIAPIIISFTFDIGGIILSLAGLSFLGYGDQRMIEWGLDISLGRTKLYSAPWAALYPGIGIIFTVLGFMLLGDGLRDALDPRLQGKK